MFSHLESRAPKTACRSPQGLGALFVALGISAALLTLNVVHGGMKGNALADKLRAQKPELKVIFSSAYSSDFATEASPVSERISFLEKPYRPEVLVRAVRDCLDEAMACAK